MAKIKMSSRLKQLMSELFEKLARQNSLKEGALEGMTFGDQIQTDTDGVIPNSRVLMSTNASNNDTLTIGGHVIKFVTSLASAYTFTQVKIGGAVATTRATLIKAVNGTADADNIVEATTTFAAAAAAAGWGVVADAPTGAIVRIREVSSSRYHGQAAYAVAKDPSSITLAEAFTDATDTVSCANINETGHAPGRKFASGKVTITAAMITFGSHTIDLEFTPDAKSLIADVRSSTDVKRAVDEALAVSASNKTIALTLAGGSSPNFQANDVFSWWISE
jgi:hypothetical protein